MFKLIFTFAVTVLLMAQLGSFAEAAPRVKRSSLSDAALKSLAGR